MFDIQSLYTEQRWQSSVVVGLMVMGLLLGSGQHALAQQLNTRPVLDEPVGPPIAQPSSMQKRVATTTALAPLPPLPFRPPLIAPLNKPGALWDVERRSTAFIPRNLDRLTRVVPPQNEAKWIRVDLSEQIVVAYEGQTPVRAFIVSSGLPRTPTVLGEFRIKTKVVAQTMSGENYHLPNVQWVQYFYEDYSFHGTYWHNKFGQPMSHGCLNMTNTDAKWLFDWAGPKWDGKSKWYRSSKDNPGTLVIITE